MIQTFVIFLREGIEASLIVSILLSYLDKIGERRLFRDVYLGVAAALVLITVGGVAAYLLVDTYAGSTAQTVFETVIYVLAAGVLVTMTFWMQAHSRSMSSDLRRRSDAAIEGRARFGLGFLAFQAVGREGVETMVFTLAIVFASTSQGPAHAQGRGLLLGAVAGMALALALAYAIFRMGRRIDLGRFFRVLGVVLIFFAAGLAADAVENMQQLGWLPFGRQVLWDTSGMLSQDSALGDVFHAMLGYAQRPTVLQAVVWLAFVAVGVTAFVVRGRRGRPGPAAAPVAPAVPDLVTT
jgi:high-affinity iron transporter